MKVFKRTVCGKGRIGLINFKMPLTNKAKINKWVKTAQ